MHHETTGRPRRGWRERVEPGIYRAHRVACPRSADHRPGGRCTCPYAVKVPGTSPGATRTVTHPGPLPDARAERRRLQAAGRPEAPRRDPESLTEFFGAWMRADAHRVAPATLYTRDAAFRRHIAPALGHRELAEITPEAVAGFLAERAAAATSARTVAKTFEVLRACLQAAVRWGRIPANPCAGIRAGRIRVGEARTRGERRVLGPDELARLFRAAGALRTASVIRTAAEAGLRRGELIGLRWGDVDLELGRLHVRRSVWQDPARGGAKTTKEPKGRRGRTVPIAEGLTRVLADWYATSVVEGGADAQGYVWPGADGTPMGAGTPTRAVERACRRAGLCEPSGRALVTLHGLRHGCGSLMLAAGVPLIAVSRFLGHADVQTTASVYAHLVSGEEQLRAASDALERLLTTRTVRGTVREPSAARENGLF